MSEFRWHTVRDDGLSEVFAVGPRENEVGVARRGKGQEENEVNRGQGEEENELGVARRGRGQEENEVNRGQGAGGGGE